MLFAQNYYQELNFVQQSDIISYEVRNLNILAFWFSDHIAHNVGLHTHKFHQLIYCKHGGGYITVGSKRFKALSEHIYFMKQGCPHSIESAPDMQLLEIKFFADNETADAIPIEFDISPLPFAREMLIATGAEGIRGEEHSDEAANSAFKLFIIHTLRRFSPTAKASRPYAHSAVLDTAEHAKENNDIKILNLRYYISDRLNEEITLSELADEVNFSKAYFIKRFTDLFGMSPMKFVNQCRIDRAKKLILQTELPLSEIALKCGFRSLHYFSRTFKTFEDISPNEYRKNQSR